MAGLLPRWRSVARSLTIAVERTVDPRLGPVYGAVGIGNGDGRPSTGARWEVVRDVDGRGGTVVAVRLRAPRRFVLPALLLLLSERPNHGYGLHREMLELRVGECDRPSTYRALAQLERDGLVESCAQPAAGQARRVYTITPLGEQVLRDWMTVIKDEYDGLGQVVRRYRATGSADAVLAEVQGGWAGDLGCEWSAVLPIGAPPPPMPPRADERDHVGIPPAGALTATTPAPDGVERRYRLLPDRSVVLIEARSTVGPVSFGAAGLTGELRALVDGTTLREGTRPTGRIDVAVDALTSGNELYDAELRRRIGARRFPTATVELRRCTSAGDAEHYQLVADLTFHGVERQIEGTVSASIEPSGRLVVAGEQVIDIRDFDIPSPTVLMLRFYPDVRVHLHVEAELIMEDA